MRPTFITFLYFFCYYFFSYSPSLSHTHTHTHTRPLSLTHYFTLPLSLSSKAAKWALIVNIVLLVAKAAAASFSGSLSVISSLVDSVLDLVGGVVFYLISNSMTKRDVAYPVGKRRFEPLGVIFLASVMGTAAFQVAIISIQVCVCVEQGG